jgi:antitoxin (DNA-binding transcriptional repressor) of toxin-antitoxin stability system
MKKVTKISIEEFECNSEALMERVEAGEYFEVERDGIVILTVRPVSQAQPQISGCS